MKPLITIISECHSENLGDQAIVRSLSSILRPIYQVSETSFGKLPVARTDGTSFSQKSQKSIMRKMFRSVPAKTKARIRWHILGEKRKFKEHFKSPVQRSSLVIVGGGQLIKNNIALFCEKLSLVSRISSSYSTPFALIGVGVDKKMDLRNWRIVKNTFDDSEFVIFRDLTSQNRVCSALNFKKGCSILPDLAFALKNPKFGHKKSDRRISLAVNVMNLETMLGSFDHVKTPDADTVVAVLCDIAKVAHHDGSTVSLFTSGTHDDFRAANTIKNEIVTRFGVDLPIFHPSTLDDLLTFLVDVNDVIATRMHAGILAYISGCNSLCLNWDDKVEGVWSAIGQPERVIDMKDIAHDDAGAKILMRLQDLTPASRHSLDELAEEVRNGVLAPIGKTLMHNQASRTLKA